jgi:hypothetical protein
MRINNISLQDTATSLGASANLSAVWLGHICNYSIQLVFTGTPAGSFKLQCSNDAGSPNASQAATLATGVTNWTDVADSSQTISAAGDLTWQVANAGYNFVRVVWTRTSSTGSLTVARINTKGV